MGNWKAALRVSRERIARRPVPYALTGICLLSFAVHAPLLLGTFLHFDDGLQIFDNWRIMDFTWDHLADTLFTNYTGKGSAPSFALSQINWALTPSYAGFALVNLLWFSGLILIFYRFTALFIAETPFRLIAALLFSLHALHVDSLGWMSSRCHMMGATFVLCCLIFWQKYRDDISPGRRALFYALAVLSAAVAVWNKGIFLVIPGLVILYDGYRQRRLSLGLLLDKIPLLVLASLPTRYTPLDSTLDNLDRPGIGPSLQITFLNDAGLLMEYLYRLVIPGPSAVSIDVYPVRSLLDMSDASSLLFMRLPPLFNLAALTLLTAIAILAFVRYRCKTPLVLWMFMLISLSPVMNVPPRWVDFAFRFEQMPLFFFAVAFGAAVAFLWRRLKKPGRIAAVSAVAILLAFHIAMSVHQARAWRSELAYWIACTKNFPDSIICHTKASRFLNEENRTKESLAHAEAILRISNYRPPNRPMSAAFNVALTMQRMGRTDKALSYFKTALAFDPLNENERARIRNAISELEKSPQKR